jgi:cytochrome b561
MGGKPHATSITDNPVARQQNRPLENSFITGIDIALTRQPAHHALTHRERCGGAVHPTRRHKMHATRYDRLTVLLHWAMALLILLQIALGLWMIELPKDDSGTRAGWFNMHKSVGMVLLLLIGLRAAWLPWRPRVTPATAGFSHWAARGSHALMYLLMVMAPLSGFLGSMFSQFPIRFFGIHLPRLAEPWDAAKELLSAVHGVSTYALIAMVLLHLLAFAYHQFVLKDRLILRMR